MRNTRFPAVRVAADAPLSARAAVRDHVREMPVAVQMFGPLEVRAGAARLAPRDFGGVEPKQVLEVLLLERGRPVAKERIADLLWGERLPQRVAATIETRSSALTQLRALAADARRTRPLRRCGHGGRRGRARASRALEEARLGAADSRVERARPAHRRARADYRERHRRCVSSRVLPGASATRPPRARHRSRAPTPPRCTERS